MIRCEIRGCRAPAKWFPVLTVDGIREGVLGAGGLVASIVACERCKRELKVDEVLTDKGWKMLQAAAEKFGVAILGGRRAVRLEWALLRKFDDDAQRQRYAAEVRQGLTA